MSRPTSAIAVYCGSNRGEGELYGKATANLGRELAARGIRLVYGGASIGLMGILADACMDGGGSVHGVITDGLRDLEIAHLGLDRLDVVATMHERKAAMSDAADAFIMLPGGVGTLDEFFEAVAWTQLRVQEKPCGVLDVEGYYGPLRMLLDSITAQGFLKQQHRDSIIFDDDAASLIERFREWTPSPTEKILGRDAV